MSVIKTQNILLPNKAIDLSKWSVVACDQYTSNPDYWEALKNYIENNPSTLNLVLPEIYLKQDNKEQIEQINKTIYDYYRGGYFQDIGPSMILINRATPKHKKRLGILMNIDLEQYSFKPDEKFLIKATEGTVIERIPPRLELRKNAFLEFPHIILFYDDREQNIAEELFKEKDKLETVYDFHLNGDGGHLTGYKISDTEGVIKKFDNLLNPEYLKKTFNSETPLLFVVGDGNHSLATAKEHWNRLKTNLSDEEKETHPARYALVEAINIHDEGIEFEAIHRAIFNCKFGFIRGLKKLYKVNKKKDAPDSYITQKVVTPKGDIEFNLPNNTAKAIKLVQDYIDKNLSRNLEMSVDYIHGEDELRNVCLRRKKAVGILLPKLDKKDLFEFIIKNGVLPRKTFSVGEANEKRYYLEAHVIRTI